MLYKKLCFAIVVTGSGTRLHVTVSHYQSKKKKKKRTGNTSVNLTITYTATISPRLHQIFSFDFNCERTQSHTHDTVTSTITITHKYDDGSLWYHQATPMWRVRKLTSAIHGRPLQPRYRKSCVACESSGVLNQTFFNQLATGWVTRKMASSQRQQMASVSAVEEWVGGQHPNYTPSEIHT